MNELTNVFAQYLGPIILVVGVSLLANKKFFLAMMKDVEKNKIALFLSGILSMAFGFSVILNHFFFTSFAAGLISVLGFMALLKGLLIILLPTRMNQLLKYYLKRIDTFLIWDAMFAVILGGYLMYIGYVCS